MEIVELLESVCVVCRSGLQIDMTESNDRQLNASKCKA